MANEERVREIALLVMNVRRRRNGLDDLDWPRMEAVKSNEGVQYALDIARAMQTSAAAHTRSNA